MRYLRVSEVVYINQKLIKDFGGTIGVRDLRLLDAAVNRPKATFDGTDLYPDLFSKAAAMFHSLIFNHAFVDGNKRTAVTAAAVFLKLNGQSLCPKEKELEKFTLNIIKKKINVEDITQWLKNSSKRL